MENPTGVAPQELLGTCTAMCPAAFVHEITSELEIHAGQPVYPIKQFKRTVNEDVGNTAPEFLRSKSALQSSMQTLRAWLRGVKCVQPAREQPLAVGVDRRFDHASVTLMGSWLLSCTVWPQTSALLSCPTVCYVTFREKCECWMEHTSSFEMLRERKS
jgi:hypothetical protein